MWSGTGYAFIMRYAQGGGLTLERQEFRERVRLEAAEFKLALSDAKRWLEA